MDPTFWKNKKVFITGHTGFKGAWLSLLLHSLGAKVTGYATLPPTHPNLFELCQLNQLTTTIYGDIRDYNTLSTALLTAEPDIIIHMAAQPIVSESYKDPVKTYETNVLGTVSLLEAVRQLANKKIGKTAVVNVTSDKSYENKEWVWGYRETDTLGGYDPYSNSKACSELVTSSYQSSFFNPNSYNKHKVAIATARAGNVIGGGDFTKNRLIPDCIQSLLRGEDIRIRNPLSIRPWQHVLEPLGAYLLLAQKLFEDGTAYASSWNFGPGEEDCQTVEEVVNKFCSKWGEASSYRVINHDLGHEAKLLKLDCSKAKQRLGWSPIWNINQAIEKVVEWSKVYKEQPEKVQDICFKQIDEYIEDYLEV